MRLVINKLVVLLVFIFCFFNCGKPKEKSLNETPLNILWINGDDLGRELACYGNPDVKTPNMDRIAKEGVLYTNAFSTAPICSTSRSSLITGMYPTAVNSHDHRTSNMTELPKGIQPITKLFQKAGYFVTNCDSKDFNTEGKQDFNFIHEDLFDAFNWTERKEGQPFFAQVQIYNPHRLFVKDTINPVDPDKVTIPKCYPDHPIIRADWAAYIESVQECDRHVGRILDQLEKDGDLENTVIILFGDHGRPHLRDKQFLYEGGLQIPLIVRYPKHVKKGTTNDALISLIDVAATSLDIAGIDVPEYMHGKVFLGEDKETRDYIYGFRQRAGDAHEDMRSIRDNRYKLIWNRTADRPWMQLSSYKKLQYPAFALYKILHKRGELGEPYNQFMADTKPEIELYDIYEDPSEFNNLANDEKFKDIKSKLFTTLKTNLVDFEKNMIHEDNATIEKAKRGSYKYYVKSLKNEKPELSPEATDEEVLKDWEERLLKK
ncbi:sulfatase [Flavivirga abyssicola]|uniref:sulfatase family protein n=1 Tax=Flavivirga abyssicola TaxID=3063533 RepID=UPI0026DEB322|nr:sulfatase [Flavivirga sp. MEBiC07777]WVK13780.1 sulfatase [Flavivirga sp. MEBiC07777]